MIVHVMDCEHEHEGDRKAEEEAEQSEPLEALKEVENLHREPSLKFWIFILVLVLKVHKP